MKLVLLVFIILLVPSCLLFQGTAKVAVSGLVQA